MLPSSGKVSSMLSSMSSSLPVPTAKVELGAVVDTSTSLGMNSTCPGFSPNPGFPVVPGGANSSVVDGSSVVRKGSGVVSASALGRPLHAQVSQIFRSSAPQLPSRHASATLAAWTCASYCAEMFSILLLAMAIFLSFFCFCFTKRLYRAVTFHNSSRNWSICLRDSMSVSIFSESDLSSSTFSLSSCSKFWDSVPLSRGSDSSVLLYSEPEMLCRETAAPASSPVCTVLRSACTGEVSRSACRAAGTHKGRARHHLAPIISVFGMMESCG
mmetsp:Transcript_79820/g.237776  ORF Transcript_79820/g.237776 Transcript_79820/m.237776 type:complete len:271 (-) Transcript_79820:47-859(-)